MSKKISRDIQIKKAILQGDFRRALSLTRHDAGESWRACLNEYENSPYNIGRSFRGTRGNKHEEFALASLSYTGDEPENERQLKLKSAKIYNQIRSRELGGGEALQYLWDNYKLPFERWQQLDIMDLLLESGRARAKSEIASMIYSSFKRKVSA
ncbi:MAG: hypothetical protein AABX11_05115 [Nanoarchaeota archaeon]